MSLDTIVNGEIVDGDNRYDLINSWPVYSPPPFTVGIMRDFIADPTTVPDSLWEHWIFDLHEVNTCRLDRKVLDPQPADRDGNAIVGQNITLLDIEKYVNVAQQAAFLEDLRANVRARTTLSSSWLLLDTPTPNDFADSLPSGAIDSDEKFLELIADQYPFTDCLRVLCVMLDSGEWQEIEDEVSRHVAELNQSIASSRLEIANVLPEDRAESLGKATGEWAELNTKHSQALDRIATKYRDLYRQKRTTHDIEPAPLMGNSRTGVQPKAAHLMFDATHVERDAYEPFIAGNRGGMRFRKDSGEFEVYHPEPPPISLRNANADKDAVKIWAEQGVKDTLSQLDEATFDLAVVAVATFYQRTNGKTIDEPFTILFSDFFAWRNIAPNHRTAEAKQEIDSRFRLLFSPEMCNIITHDEIYLTDSDTGRKKRQPVTLRGSWLSNNGFAYVGHQANLFGLHDGYNVRLGEWARPYVQEKAMLGVYLRRLASYDLRRQTYERRIGQYLVFQFNNQASHCRFDDPANIQMQQPLRMVSILDGARIPDWREAAKKDPKRIIDHFVSALQQLQRDKIIGPYSCRKAYPDNAACPADGSDLGRKGRLAAMLERRYYISPGAEIVEHFRRTSEEAKEAKALAQKAASQRDAKKLNGDSTV